ncbi:MAG: DNA topoisomerase IB, partial [Alphaproteobacteria bacterium]|nr:DNA topoisomerase IB [Alphaproteobacteria bacterium]
MVARAGGDVFVRRRRFERERRGAVPVLCKERGNNGDKASLIFAMDAASPPLAVQQKAIEAAFDPTAAARIADLRYVHDWGPGITRHRAGISFSYRDADGRLIRDPKILKRIKSLAIPPAWREVWICPHANGHLQAVGRDARGRKQYRYHPRWRQVRDEAKYGRMLIFVRVLPLIRARVSEDLSRPGLPRERVLAAIVRLLETT